MAELKDAFISYGRRESLSLAARLHRELTLSGRTCWFDKVNIPDGDDYAMRINHGIETAHNFLFVMAPRSLASVHCLIELEYAKQLGKRVIPIQHVEAEDTLSFPLSLEEKAALTYFYKEQDLIAPRMETTDDVSRRCRALLGKADWLDAQESFETEELNRMGAWADEHENHWHKHADIAYLGENELPIFGKGGSSFSSVLERIEVAINREKDYVEHHTQLLEKALFWHRHKRMPKYLLVGAARRSAIDWLLQPFTNGRQAPCSPIALQCEYICESRKNAENLMVDAFICHDQSQRMIRDRVIVSLSRYATTSWLHDKDIRKDEDYEQAVLEGIEEADNFLFFVSGASLASPSCLREYRHAYALQKRIIPLLIGKVTEEEKAPFEGLDKLQYIDFTDNTESSDFTRDIDSILTVMRQERKYHEEHKQLLVKALRWERKKQAHAFLLRGYSLENAKTWLRLNTEREKFSPTTEHQHFIAASEAAKGQLSTDVFISYSRSNSAFARKINNNLQEAQKTTWFDQESISSGADFQQEIYQGISAADNFLFIITPESIDSPYCHDEVEYAMQQHKRIITVLHQSVLPEEMPEALRQIHWIDFERRNFEASFAELIQAIEVDKEHNRQHTKWQQRAIEWDDNGRHEDFLLNASARRSAEAWLAQTQGKLPEPTRLQRDFIEESQKARSRAVAAQKEVSDSLRRRLQITWGALALVLILLVVAIVAIRKSNRNFEKAQKLIGHFGFNTEEQESQQRAWMYNIEKGKFALINQQGDTLTGFDFEQPHRFSGNYAIAFKQGHVLIDRSGEVISPSYLDYIIEMENGNYFIAQNNGTLQGFIRGDSGAVGWFQNLDVILADTIPFWDEQGLQGLATPRGDIIISPQYDETNPFENGFSAVAKHGLWGFVNTQGVEVIPTMYENIGEFSEGFARVMKDSKWGFVRADGKTSIPPKYEAANAFSEGLAQVAIDNRWGFIDTLGKEVIPLQFEDALPFSEGLAAVKQDGQWGFINASGQMQLPLQYEQVNSFEQGIALVNRQGEWLRINPAGDTTSATSSQPVVRSVPAATSNGQWGFTNAKGEAFDYFIQPFRPLQEASGAGHFNEGFAPFYKIRMDDMGIPQSKWGFVDHKGNTSIAVRYDYARYFSEGLAVVNIGGRDNFLGYFSGGKWGAIDSTGQTILPLDYDNLGDFHEGLATYSEGGFFDLDGYVDGKWGCIDRSGNTIIPAQYDAISDFGDGMAAVRQGEFWGYIDKNGDETIPPTFKEARHFSQGLAPVKEGKAWYFINRSGKKSSTQEFQELRPFSEDISCAKQEGKWGAIDIQGKLAVSFQYDELSDFHNGIAIAEQNGKKGIVNKLGNEIIPLIYDAIHFYNEPLNIAKVELDGKAGFISIDKTIEIHPTYSATANQIHNNLIAVKLDDFWGYIDTKGKTIIPFIYEDCTNFSGGHALVKRFGLWHYINKDGRMSIPNRPKSLPPDQ